MCTRVNTTAWPDVIRHHELSEQLRLGVDTASALSRLNSIVGSRLLTLSDLQQLVSLPRVSSMLSMLAPAEFSRVRAHTAGGSRSALETTAADLQAELAETLAVAIAALSSVFKQPREVANPHD